ncbi:MAG: tetratricopeptide repeat protein [Candidatus Sumerlaeia bacterium]|nr:tetratricopeptide repeat protein [Candidatus Sumerlaeia bacterium]
MDREEKIARLEALLAIEAEANDPLTHFLLGREYLEAGRAADAVRAFERCVALNPQYTAAYRFLGDSHRKAGDAAHARETYQLGIGVAEQTGDLQAGREMQALLARLEGTR